MKIGIDARCLEWNRGGVARYLINMLKIWADIVEPSDFEFILYFQNYVPDDEFLRHPLYKLKLLKGPSLLKSHRILAEQFLMPNQVGKDNLDLYFATWYSAPLMLKNTKIVVGAWDISYSTHPKHYSIWNRISLGYFSRKSCEKSVGVVTCSDYDASQIHKYYHIPKNKICTLYLAADDRFTPSVDQKGISKLKIKLNLPEHFILSMGIIHNRRNVDVIIKAFKELRDKYPDLGLVIIGRNNTKPYIDIEGMMKPLIETGCGVYIPWFEDEDLVELYKAAYLYICTSTVDGETILLKESMKVGTPVITSKLLEGTIGGNGYIIDDPESIKQTKSIIEQALNDTDREALVSKGIEWNKQFSWSKVAKDSLQFFKLR